MAHALLEKSIIEILGIGSLPDEEKVALVTAMGDLVEKQIIMRLAQGLHDDDAAKLDTLAAADDSEELVNFLREKVPHFEKILEEEVLAMKKEAQDIAVAIDREIEGS